MPELKIDGGWTFFFLLKAVITESQWERRMCVSSQVASSVHGWKEPHQVSNTAHVDFKFHNYE